MEGRESLGTGNVMRDGAVDAREGVTPTGNRRPQSQDTTRQRVRRIIRRARAQRRQAKGRAGKSGGGAKKRMKPKKI